MSKAVKNGLKIGGMIILVVVLFLVIVAVMTYFFNDNSILSQSMRRIVPMPAATVNKTHWVSSAAVDDNMRALQKQLEDPLVAESGLRVDFSTEEGQKRLLVSKKGILNKMIEDEVIVILSEERALIVDEAAARAELDQIFTEASGDKGAAEEIEESYGWDVNTFMERIALPSKQRMLLEEWYYANHEPDPSLREKMLIAKKELDDNRDFASVAQKYSEGPSAAAGGEIGWWEKELLMQELAEAAFSMRSGDVSDIIETPMGYHIILVRDTKEADDANEKAVNLSQIFIAKKTFGEWLEEQMRTMAFSVPATDFTWDDERQVVDFTDEEMRNFERESRDNPQGDASLL